MERIVNSCLNFIRKYGFLLVLIFCFGGFSPALYPKVGMMDLDLSNRIDSKSGSNLFKQLFWVSLFFFYLFCFYFDKNKIIIKKNFNNALIAFSLIISISFISMLWSSFPSYVFKRTFFQLIFITVCILSFYFSYKKNNTAKCIELCLYYMFFLILLTLIMGWGLTSDLSLAGYEKGKNVLGINLVVIYILYSFFCKSKSKKNDLIVLFTLFSLIILTQSKTCFLLVVMFFILTKFKQSHIKIINTSLLLFLVVGFIVMPCITYYSNSYMHIGLYVDPEFITGRGYIWDTIYYDLSFYKNIFLGYGYASYFGTPEIPYFFDDSHSFLRYITSSHNGYLSLLIQFGVLSITIVSLFAYVTKNIEGRVGNAAITIIIFHNITEASFYRDNTVIWMLFLIVVAFSLVKKVKISE
ncbi:O-antigen ligase family protein [Pseudoalteromonas sp. SR43-7]|uniref:O-antigen ligase family protein n=1 Tax=Pseudoalteromonas sp. SR43-7 TaxID=2760939 RepID=UPI0015FE3CB7|nr:O-antigen ligase family protein [Pseudoalteromonas sp. SR43-7]MBB1330213.1 O-antigen ligase family protein [Pseudoalteromonas sp. SR43-7]